MNFSPRLQVLRSISLTQEGSTFLFCLSYLGVLFHTNLMESLVLVQVFSATQQLSACVHANHIIWFVLSPPIN